ncbi:unnamed protein product [Durusdinium trenchii]|uniref:Adenylate kinase n=1 Tax=Durusdinium trenchii TaxID=1381693 RepID=A0ABP0MGQ1_9DINO
MGQLLSCKRVVPGCSKMVQPWHVILVAGPPAAGKGTVCDGLKKRYGLVHISPGQILRDEVSKESELGLQVKQYMTKGMLVPHELVMEIVQERLCRPDVLNRGCLLDNFPLTAEQAAALTRHFRVEKLLFMDVPEEDLVVRSTLRRLDPLTGRIYHLKFRPPPEEIAFRLVQRSDDQEESVKQRIETYNQHVQSILPSFEGKTSRIDGRGSPQEVLAAACAALEDLEWTSAELPYFGNVAFAGPFSITQAKRAGFYSPENPPEEGEKVVCFQRGANWQRRGIVQEVNECSSEGQNGLRRGFEGMLVTLADNSESFRCWSAFLAPVNDKEYSALCTTHGFLSSHFSSLYPCSKGVGDVNFVSKEDAKISLRKWLQELEDADGEPFEVTSDALNSVLKQFDEHEDGSLYLYTTHQKLGRRISLVTGLDYSLYYRALNNTLNCDASHNLSNAIVLIQRMIYCLLYSPTDGSRILHAGGRVWKGDTQRPVPLNMQKLREALRLERIVRFRQFQSTTKDHALAEKYRRREDGRGYLWVIDIPRGFWGARDIQNISSKDKESETLFPPYSAFRVQSLDDNQCHLLAVDRGSELSDRADRHGLRGSSVKLC